jgi:hypothetical protein
MDSLSGKSGRQPVKCIGFKRKRRLPPVGPVPASHITLHEMIPGTITISVPGGY